MYRGLEIGTAAPTAEELSLHKHYFVGQLQPGDYYSAARYEQEVMQLLKELHDEGTTIIMVTHSQHDAGFAGRTINLFDGSVVNEVRM